MAAGLCTARQEADALMSKNINVNPGQYKVAGRERMGENLGQEKAKQVLAKAEEKAARKPKGGKKR